MPITLDQRNRLISELVPIANAADNILYLTPAGSTPPEKGLIAHALRFDSYNTDTLRMFLVAFPNYTFLQQLTAEDLPALAEALKAAYDEDVEAHRNKVPSTT